MAYPPEYLYKVEYTTEGATDLTVTFEYLLPEHVYVVRAADGTPEGEGVILSVGTDWVWLDPFTIQLTEAIAAGETITIQRQTRIDDRMVDYTNGANLGEDDLNIIAKQLLFLIQEITQARVEIPGLGGGGGGGGGGGLSDEEVEDLIDEILSTQLFLDLVELIPLLDINAELIIANQLNNHRDWLISGDFDFKLDTQGTLIQQHQYELFDENGALAQLGTTVAARFDDNEAAILTLQTSEATQDSAIATLQTEVQARVPSDELEGLISLSSYVNAIKASADLNSGDIFGITSALVGVGGDFENPEETSILGIFQTTFDGHAGLIDANTLEIEGLAETVDPEGDGVVGVLYTWKQNLSAFFNANPDNGSSLASAMQNKWQVYADSESATATAVQTLEANTQPLFFREDPPDPQDPEFAGTSWDTYGFPEGSMWYKVLPGNLTRPYIYSTTNGPGAIALSVGYWIDATDDQLNQALGAKIQELSNVVIGEDRTVAEMETILQAVWGGNIASVAQAVTAYLQPPSTSPPVSPGIMYSGYNVRANLNIEGQEPVIAGFGLGIQADPFNPNAEAVSDFIVMADRFSVVIPPTVGTILEGPLDHTTVTVPFIVDGTQEPPQVVINGNLFVRGTLKAYEGGLYDISCGQIQSGQLNSDIELADPLGVRVGMYSSTGGFWESNTASPFPGGSNPQKFLLWAGSGVKNHNNAIFYVDTDENAYFGGQISADNIDGDLSTLSVLSVFGSEKTANSTTNPMWLTNGSGTSIFSVGGSNTRGRKPFAMVNVDMHGSGANEGRARMEMRLETAPGVYGSWINVSEFPIAQETGTTLTLAGGINTSTSYGAQVRVGILQQNGSSPKSNGYQGIFVMTA